MVHHTMAELMETDCPACGNMHGQPMTYCGAFLEPMDDCSAETESMSDEESFDPPPPPTLPLVESPEMYEQRRLTVREQEIRFIEENGLVAFCHAAMITAVLQDADYLRAQLVYLAKP